MNLQEAFESAMEGNFITHNNFDSNQSMHSYAGDLYYEDGANLMHHLSWLKKENWAKGGWSIKYTKEQVDTIKLAKMHEDNSSYMLKSGSYEDCVNK